MSDETDDPHEPRRLATIRAAYGEAGAEIEVASTPDGDAQDTVEIRVIVRERDGVYHRHAALVHRSSIPFLIEELEAHRFGENLDPCDACAAQAFAARLADSARRREHTCPAPTETGVP